MRAHTVDHRVESQPIDQQIRQREQGARLRQAALATRRRNRADGRREGHVGEQVAGVEIIDGRGRHRIAHSRIQVRITRGRNA